LTILTHGIEAWTWVKKKLVKLRILWSGQVCGIWNIKINIKMH